MATDFFKTRGFIPGGILHNKNNQAMNIESLPAFLRTLLVADGTVTKSLEAFFWEPIKVELLDQNPIILEQALPFISAHSGTEVMQRTVVLKGDKSERVYCYASSYIKLDSLDEALAIRLVNGEIGIGELLREVGLETYREIMDVNQDKLGSGSGSGSGSGNNEKLDSVSRVYVINIAGQAAIQITERFPLAPFQENQIESN